MIETAYIGLGSNLEQPEQQLKAAVDALGGQAGIQLDRGSWIYASPPMGPQDQPDFLNACLAITTQLDPMSLLGELQAVELQMGRTRTRHWGERCIDLDLLLFGNLKMTTRTLTLPHPGVYSRAFVLVPLADIAGGGFVMPDGRSIDKLLCQCDTSDIRNTSVRLLTD